MVLYLNNPDVAVLEDMLRVESENPDTTHERRKAVNRILGELIREKESFPYQLYLRNRDAGQNDQTP